MGVLNIATPDTIRSFSILPEVKDMDDDPLQGYLDRAEFLLSRRYDYDTALASYTTMMKIAVQLLTENLVLKGLPAYRRSMLVDIISERIGTYSYTRGSAGKDTTVHMYADGTDDEIMSIARAYATKGDIEYSGTVLFPRRTFIVDKSGTRYYFPEYEDLQIGQLEDPSMPL